MHIIPQSFRFVNTFFEKTKKCFQNGLTFFDSCAIITYNDYKEVAVMTIYERIKSLRLALGMSQAELAKKVGYEGRSAISKVENGERDISQSMIEQYAKALNVSPTYLLYGDSYDEINDQWSSTFCESLKQELLLIDSTAARDSGVDLERLQSVASGEVPISLSEACDIADEIGVSLDYMVGISKVDSKTIEFIKLFSRLTTDQQSLVISQIKGILSNQ